MLLSFMPGSSDGDMVCYNVTILSDDLVESEEDFTVELTLNTIDDGIQFGNNITAVTLIDSNGMYIWLHSENFNVLVTRCSCNLFDSHLGNGC